MLGNLLGIDDFDYLSSTEVRDELKEQLGEITPDNTYRRKAGCDKPNGEDAPASEIDIPIYEVDGIVRRATALQLTPEAQRARGDDS